MLIKETHLKIAGKEDVLGGSSCSLFPCPLPWTSESPHTSSFLYERKHQDFLRSDKAAEKVR